MFVSFCYCLLVTLVYSLYALGCLFSALFLIFILCVYLSKKKLSKGFDEIKLGKFLI